MSGATIVLVSPNMVMKQAMTSKTRLNSYLQQKVVGALVEGC